MAWLDPNEDILPLLRGTYREDFPAPPHSEAVLDLLLAIVISGMLLIFLIIGPMYLWFRFTEARHLKRRAALAASNSGHEATG
jgi:hypothetical protein